MKISHWHLGYYKDGNFFEDEKWVVYYDDSHDTGLFVKTQPRHELFGVVIFIAQELQ